MDEIANTPVVVDDASLAALIGRGVVLVDFWAAWCGPCRAVAPILVDLAAEYGDRVKVAKLNVDENPRSAHRYGVRAIPTLIIFKDGEVLETFIGARSKGQLRSALDGALRS